jgi:predicted small lipoprotein YifL
VKRIAILALAALSLAGALASCGRQGELARPGPLWGPRHLTPRERADLAEQQRHEAERASNATATNTPIPPQNPAIEPYTNPGPIQDNPIPGERPNPAGPPTNPSP